MPPAKRPRHDSYNSLLHAIKGGRKLLPELTTGQLITLLKETQELFRECKTVIDESYRAAQQATGELVQDIRSLQTPMLQGPASMPKTGDSDLYPNGYKSMPTLAELRANAGFTAGTSDQPIEVQVPIIQPLPEDFDDGLMPHSTVPLGDSLLSEATNLRQQLAKNFSPTIEPQTEESLSQNL